MSSFRNCLQRPLLLDGGLGMQLIHDGYEIVKKSPLWSADLVYSNPAAIESAHLKFLDAGAEIIETATYQMSFDGFSRHLNCNSTETECYFEKAVQLVRSAIEKYKIKDGCNTDKRIFVAGSLGAYGAILADRSEYTGAYWDLANIREKVLTENRLRLSAMIKAGVDLIAVETIPSTQEADVILELLMSEEFCGTPFYLSFVTHDGITTPRGENLLHYLKTLPQKIDMSLLFGVGLNCSSIENISSFVDLLANSRQDLHPEMKFLFYPNLEEPLELSASERYVFWSSTLKPWFEILGKSSICAIGGCCHVVNDDISAISRFLSDLV